jgi:hypothetical protein
VGQILHLGGLKSVNEEKSGSEVQDFAFSPLYKKKV